MSRKLSDKALAFCQEYTANWFNGTRAYKKCFEQQDDLKAAISASRLLKDQRVKDEINNIEWDYRNIGFKEWITKEFIIKTLYWMMNAEKIVSVKKWKDWKAEVVKWPDWKTRFDWVMWFAKLTWDLSERKKIEITDWVEEEWEEEWFSEMSAEDLRQYREKVLENIKIVN